MYANPRSEKEMIQKNSDNPKGKMYMKNKNRRFPVSGILLVIAFLIISVCSSGCINKVMNHTDEETAITEDITPSVTEDNPVAVPIVTETVPQITPMKSDVVTEVTPFTTPNPYPLIHGVQINGSPQYGFQYRQPEFTKTYTLGGNAVGLLVNVVQGPLYIVYTVNPKYDCLDDPDSCRGTVFASRNRPYMTITVRDNSTQEIVAKDGYAREYSSDTGTYTFETTGSSSDDSNDDNSVSSSNDNSDNGDYRSTPGPRYIPIYKEGQFQITIDGNYLDVTVSIITGASPDLLTAQEKTAGATTTPATNSDDWE